MKLTKCEGRRAIALWQSTLLHAQSPPFDILENLSQSVKTSIELDGPMV